ncbi:hypothetical protein DPI70_25545, partial [Escherichia coli]|nr:hypothetical protein [Escherichia coli]
DIESVDVSTPVNRGLSVSGEMINSPDCHKMVDAFLENHGNGFRSEDINAVREVVTDIFQLESPDRIGQMMDKVRELQRYKNDETSLSVKIEVSDETTSVALFINDSPFKCTIWHGKNASNHLKGINLSGINLKGSILRNVDLTRATLIGANLSVVTGKSSSQGFS